MSKVKTDKAASSKTEEITNTATPPAAEEQMQSSATEALKVGTESDAKAVDGAGGAVNTQQSPDVPETPPDVPNEPIPVAPAGEPMGATSLPREEFHPQDLRGPSSADEARAIMDKWFEEHYTVKLVIGERDEWKQAEISRAASAFSTLKERLGL